MSSPIVEEQDAHHLEEAARTSLETALPTEEAVPSSLEALSAFTSDPLELPHESFPTSFETSMPISDAQEGSKLPGSPQSSKLAHTEQVPPGPEGSISHQHAEYRSAAAKTPESRLKVDSLEPQAKSPLLAVQQVVDLTMEEDDDDDDVEIIAATTPQDSVPIKVEPNKSTNITQSHSSDAVALSIEHSSNLGTEQLEMLNEYLRNQREIQLKDRRSPSHGLIQEEDETLIIDSDQEDTKALAEFEQVKKDYEAKKKGGKASLIEEIEFRKAQNAEKARLCLRQAKKAYDAEHHAEEHAMFFPEQPSKSAESDMIDVLEPVAKTPARSAGGSEAPIVLNGDESELESLDDARQRTARDRGPVKKPKKHDAARAKVTKDGITKRRGSGTRRGTTSVRGRGRARKTNSGPALFDISSFLPYDIQEQARLNRQQPDQPQFTSVIKQKALAELLASIPEGERDLHVGDKRKLHEATKKFTGHGAMKADAHGKWRLRGMLTSLHHYQVTGVAAMRDMEKKAQPCGGILSDDMGLGKTVMAIANIVDGRAEPSAQVKTTLVVAPAGLMEQWRSEIKRHADPKFVKRVMIYRSSQIDEDSDPGFMLSHYDIVITSYYEIVKSLPDRTPPPGLSSARAKEDWWEKHFEENKGPLHQIKFHRLILDEAQAIKNHESKTSEAAWRLRGKFRWALSGTPVQNSLTEFFSYFRFLKIRLTGDFETWKKNYCKRGSEAALRRLRSILHGFVIRRTHQDQMFGRPILQLPPITNRTIELKFSTLERTIYRIVRDRFVKKLKGIQGKTGSKSSYQMIFVLLLRLRQLTAHILLIQNTLKELLEAEDLERLWELTKPGHGRQLSEDDVRLLKGLETAIATRDQACSPGSSLSGDGQPTPPPASASRRAQTDNELSCQFRRCLQLMRQDGQWDEANKRSICHLCGNPPIRPHITSCLHIYCFSCINELAMLATQREEEDAICLECGLKLSKTEALATVAFDEAAEIEPGTLAAVRSGPDRRRSSNGDDETLDWYKVKPVLQSTKTSAAIQQIETWFDENGKNNSNKILVFSQFRGVLKILGRMCEEKGWRYESFAGDQSFEARNKAVSRFSLDDNCKILLAGMKSGGVGLNLTKANRVILIDLWWNLAFCRVFRIGQDRDVEVVRFAVKNTIDMEIIEMQERKKAEIESATHKRHTVGGLSTVELLRLFGDGTDVSTDGIDGVEHESFIMPNDPYAKVDSDGDNDGPNAMVTD